MREQSKSFQINWRTQENCATWNFSKSIYNFIYTLLYLFINNLLNILLEVDFQFKIGFKRMLKHIDLFNFKVI